MIDIPNIVIKPLRPLYCVAPVYLGPAGNAGFHIMPSFLVIIVQRQVLHQQGSRAYKRHVAFQHIDQLGQLVQRGFAHKLPDARQALIIRQKIALYIPRIGHGFEFDYAKYFFPITGPWLNKPDRTFVEEDQQENNQQEDWGNQNQQDKRNGPVDEGFKDARVQTCSLGKQIYGYPLALRAQEKPLKSKRTPPQPSLRARHEREVPPIEVHLSIQGTSQSRKYYAGTFILAHAPSK
jgi:hypothetical protein